MGRREVKGMWELVVFTRPTPPPSLPPCIAGIVLGLHSYEGAWIQRATEKSSLPLGPVYRRITPSIHHIQWDDRLYAREREQKTHLVSIIWGYISPMWLEPILIPILLRKVGVTALGRKNGSFPDEESTETAQIYAHQHSLIAHLDFPSPGLFLLCVFLFLIHDL